MEDKRYYIIKMPSRKLDVTLRWYNACKVYTTPFHFSLIHIQQKQYTNEKKRKKRRKSSFRRQQHRYLRLSCVLYPYSTLLKLQLNMPRPRNWGGTICFNEQLLFGETCAENWTSRTCMLLVQVYNCAWLCQHNHLYLAKAKIFG